MPATKKEKETKPVIIATRKLHFFEDACVNEIHKIKKPHGVSNYFFLKVVVEFVFPKK